MIPRVAAAVLSGILTVLALSPRGRGWLAWIALVPLFVAIAGAPRRAIIACAVAYTITFSLAGLEPWFARSTAAYFAIDLGPMIAFTVPPLTLLAVVHGIVLGGALLARPRRAGPADVVFVAAVWTCWEMLRTLFFPYYPAAVFGLTQHAVIPVLQLASVTGVAGISFVVVACNAGLASLASRARPGRSIAAALAGVALAGGVATWGAVRVRDDGPPIGPRVVTVDIDARERGASTLDRYLSASTEAVALAPALVVWPESALTTDLEHDRTAWAAVNGFVTRAATPLLAGGPGIARRTDGKVANFNSAHLVVPGHGLRSYHKRGLVPFAERWPPLAAKVLGDPPRDLTSLDAGEEATVFTAGDRPFGVLICFEVTSAGLARSLVARGARFLVNITNDAWFAGCARPPHLPWAAIRAVETGLPVVRAANAGPSGVFDRFGRRLASGTPPLFATRVPEAAETVYTRIGDVFLFGCLGVVLAGVAAAWRRL